ncbi:Pisatin demethylase [Talaromyces islandicus]|uniref:Pisatin demethylase n=1 Tax=Talaromyces islandicus TaxID=28573 RepID=A0A0U1LUJ7_TALIS|nr:Pisatin demethylase [Talaromyces islandicus]
MASRLISTFLDSQAQDARPYTFIIGIVVIAIVALVAHLRNPLNSIPGPFWARWTPFWLAYYANNGNMHRKMIETHKKYGGLVRTGPNEVSVSNPRALKVIYGAGNNFRKSEWYSVWQGVRKWDLFGERNEDIHRAQKKLVSQVYSLSNMKKLEPYVNSAVVIFIDKLIAQSHAPIQMNKWAQLFAFDVIGEITFSKRFGFMESGNDDGAFAMIENSLRSAAWVGYVPWVYWTNLKLSPILGSHLAVTARQGGLLTFAAKAIAERKERGSEHQDILGQFFDVQQEKPEFNDMSITSMVASNIFAGSDSTATSISSFLFFVCKNPESRRKLVEEVDAVAKAQNIKRGTVFSLETANEMPYLQACMWEALRCFPAVGMNLGRVAPPSGVEIDGKFIPGGTVVGANAWVIHQDKDTFGEDAHKFRPERWMEDAERVGDMKRGFFSFGGGSRLCIGRNIAWLEMSKLVPTLFHVFDIELPDPSMELIEHAWSFVKIENFRLKMKVRGELAVK